MAADAAAARERAGATLADAAASVERSTAGIDGVLTRLADTITRLDGRQVILEAAPQRSWWSSLFGGRG